MWYGCGQVWKRSVGGVVSVDFVRRVIVVLVIGWFLTLTLHL